MKSPSGGDNRDLGITLVSHASVLLDTPAGTIWTDPWMHSRAFNDSWALLGDPVVSDEALERVSWIWISHEHPDHFNVPTLRNLPDELKQRVTVLFQANNSDKMVKAFNAFGFSNTRRLPHRAPVDLAPGLQVSCYQVGQMDSALYVSVTGGPSVLNVNDAELNSRDCADIVRTVGSPDVVLNQFSIAGYDGLPDPEERLQQRCRTILDNVVENHRDLHAGTTIPIASFVYFCAPDNAYLNEHINQPVDVVRRLEAEGLSSKVLAPGERWEVGSAIDNEASLAYWSEMFSSIPELAQTSPPIMDEAELRRAFSTCCERLRAHFPSPLLRAVSPLVVRVPDLGSVFRTSIADATFEVAEEADVDVVINSQPLHFVFAQPFGLQTLGVSGRYRLTGPSSRWRRLRILMSLENAEIYLRPRHLADPTFLRFVAGRARGGVNQLAYQVRRM